MLDKFSLKPCRFREHCRTYGCLYYHPKKTIAQKEMEEEEAYYAAEEAAKASKEAVPTNEVDDRLAKQAEQNAKYEQRLLEMKQKREKQQESGAKTAAAATTPATAPTVGSEGYNQSSYDYSQQNFKPASQQQQQQFPAPHQGQQYDAGNGGYGGMQTQDGWHSSIDYNQNGQYPPPPYQQNLYQQHNIQASQGHDYNYWGGDTLQPMSQGGGNPWGVRQDQGAGHVPPNALNGMQLGSPWNPPAPPMDFASMPTPSEVSSMNTLPPEAKTQPDMDKVLTMAERLKISSANAPAQSQPLPTTTLRMNTATKQTIRIPQELWVDTAKRSPRAFEIVDPLLRFHEVNAVHQMPGVLDMHFQTASTVDRVLDQVIPNTKMFEKDEDGGGYVWIVTGTGHHTTQRLFKMFDVVKEYLDEHNYNYKVGVDKKGYKGAFYVRITR